MQGRTWLLAVLTIFGVAAVPSAEATVTAATGTPVAATAWTPFSGQVATFTESNAALGPANFTATVDWGDATTSAGTVTGGSGAFAVTGSHTYSAVGTFTVVTTITSGNSFTAIMAGTQEVPPNASTATGAGTVDLNLAENQITVNVTFSGLTAPATAAHIHGSAPPGTNAPVAFALAGVPAATAGTIPAQIFAVAPVEVGLFRVGLYYLNVHTSNFPGGEIRGQLYEQATTARASAAVAGQLVPALGSTGFAVLALVLAGIAAAALRKAS